MSCETPTGNPVSRRRLHQQCPAFHGGTFSMNKNHDGLERLVPSSQLFRDKLWVQGRMRCFRSEFSFHWSPDF
jgi:hypothetical protein